MVLHLFDQRNSTRICSFGAYGKFAVVSIADATVTPSAAQPSVFGSLPSHAYPVQAACAEMQKKAEAKPNGIDFMILNLSWLSETAENNSWFFCADLQ
ncbi:hypothetical protein [Sphaerotilus montanus]|uniref:hypothetical protein n=1 Tax=Sphaerotilus montanus TaxID=522889 RepID=UPI003FA28271